jgi:hypothetical protein
MATMRVCALTFDGEKTLRGAAADALTVEKRRLCALLKEYPVGLQTSDRTWSLQTSFGTLE